MPNNQIAPGSWDRCYLAANDDTNTGRLVSALSVTIDNYGAAYVAPGGDGVGSFAVVPKSTPPKGASVTVTVTVNAKDLAGNDLPGLPVAFDILGPPADPLATHLVLLSANVVVGGVPADPGSATATLL